jgi:hypothetical protein
MRKPGSSPFLLVALAAGLLAATPERGDPGARLSRADGALEYWDLVARFDQGHRLVARVLVTNEGPGEQTAVGVGHLIQPDGEVVEFRNGRLQGRWSVADDARSLRIGSTELGLAGPVRTLDYDNNKRGIEIRLRLRADASARFPRAGEPTGYRVDLLDLAARVDGTVLLPGMTAPVALSGRATFLHTWTDQSEPSIVLRRIDFSSLEPGAQVYLRDVLTTEGKRHQWLVVVQDGHALIETSEIHVDLETARGGSTRGYPLPSAIRVRGPGGVSGRIALERKLLEHDPLGDLPQPFRFLLSFDMRPRRVWTDSSFSLGLDATPGRAALELSGIGITSVTFLNPLDSPAFGS